MSSNGSHSVQYMVMALLLQGEAHTICGRFMVAADGASSGVRDMIGVPLEGEATLQHLVNIHFLSPTLAHRLQQVTR